MLLISKWKRRVKLQTAVLNAAERDKAAVLCRVQTQRGALTAQLRHRQQ